MANLTTILRTEELNKDIEFLTTDLLHKMNPGYCYAIITDPMYQDILQRKLVQEIQRSTYFIINVPFNEDMLKPESKIQQSLNEARTSGCQVYVIYLSNGIQMRRFLQFIDK